MNTLRKKCALLITSMALLTSFLHGGEMLLEQPNYCCSPPVCCQESSGRFFVRGDLLYFKPNISGLELDFGNTAIAQTTTEDVQIINSSEFDADPHFKWDAGYRIGAGYQFADSGLEISAFWTHFQGKGSRSNESDLGSLSSGHCRLKFDQIDAVLSYKTCLTPSFILKPFIGVRAAKIHESLNAELITDIFLASDVITTGIKTYNDHQRFEGVGPILGFQGDWDIGNGFGIYGTAATSVLYGYTKVRFQDSEIFAAPISVQAFNTNQRNLHRFNCTIDLALGLSWETCLFDSFQLCMKLGFEHHQYFNESYLGTNRGDLSLDGGIFSISIAL